MSIPTRGFAAVALCLLSLAGACASSGPEAVAQQFIDSVKKGEISSAMDLVSNESREAIGDAQLREHLRDASDSELSRVIAVSAGDSAVSSDGRSARVRLTGEEETDEVGMLHLIKEDGRWKIDLSMAL